MLLTMSDTGDVPGGWPPPIVADEVEIYLSDRAATPDLVRFLSDRAVGVASESEPGRVTVRLGHPRAIVELSVALSSWLEADGCELRMSTPRESVPLRRRSVTP